MKLLFDQNLSPRLPRLLSSLYAGSLHVRDVGLKEADDTVIWKYAIDHDYAIVSKDTDFQQRSLLHGHPPKFIWLRVGNGPTRIVEELLRSHSTTLHTFAEHPTESHLILP